MLFKAFTTIRTHWKKSIFFTGVSLYGGNYLYGLYKDSLVRVKYCKEARKYGLQPIHNQQPRRITVFLNPAANKGKARKLFEKNVAPLLFLAGLQVTTVKTEHEGQAKRYMEVVEDTDAIIVAGGDGTLGEVITGILRRPDQEKFSKIPIGVIPVGVNNTLANCIQKKGESVVEWMAKFGMAIVQETTRPIDVMKIESNEGKTVFAVSSLLWGEYNDADNRKTRYWFTGPLKHRFTYIMSTFSNPWPPNKHAELSYSYGCSGCSRCYQPPAAAPKRWWSGLTPPPKPVIPAYASRDNPECGKEYKQGLNAIELQIDTRNDSEQIQEENSLKILTGPETISKSDFMQEGWSRVRHPKVNKGDKLLEAPILKLNPELSEDDNTMFTIDNELFEAMPIEVTLLKNKLNIFCPLVMS